MKWLTNDGYIEVEAFEISKSLTWTFAGITANEIANAFSVKERKLPVSLQSREDEIRITVLNRNLKCV